MAKSRKLEYNRAHLHFSKEQKIQIVQEIESGILTRNEAREKYNIVGHQTLTSWLVQYGTTSGPVTRKRYGKADQRLAAYRIITGESTVDQTARDMTVNVNTVYIWVSKYKKDIQHKQPSDPEPKSKEEVTSEEKDQQKELEALRLKVAGLEMMIDIAEKELKIDIRKKSGTKQ